MTPEIVPVEAFEETIVTPAGNVSFSTMLVAVLGPRFVTVTRKVKLLPTTAAKGVLTMLTAMSAAGPTIVDTLAVLFPGKGSACNATILDVAVIVPSANGET